MDKEEKLKFYVELYEGMLNLEKAREGNQSAVVERFINQKQYCTLQFLLEHVRDKLNGSQEQDDA